jgi:hypothetical protein
VLKIRIEPVMMNRRPATRRHALQAAFLIAITVIAALYAVVVAATDGVGSALLPILIAILFGVNCIRFLTGRAFPSRPEG